MAGTWELGCGDVGGNEVQATKVTGVIIFKYSDI